MKKIVVIVILLMAGLQAVQAQDLITTKKGDDIQAKVLEVSDTEVKYLKYNNQDGPVYVIDTRDILLIRYENGEKDIFTDADVYEPVAVMPVQEGMRYKEYSHLYNTRGYHSQWGDTYEPALSGVASAFIPGLGQCLTGEWSRGLFFFGGYIALGVTMGNLTSDVDSPIYQSDLLKLLVGSAFIGGYIWNICDAVKVAKIKNLYLRDIRGQRTAVELSITPYLDCTPASSAAGSTPVGGLALRMNF